MESNIAYRLLYLSHIFCIIHIIGIAKNNHATHRNIPRANIAEIEAKGFNETFSHTTFGNIKYSSICWIVKYQINIHRATHIDPVKNHHTIVANNHHTIVPTVGTNVAIAENHHINNA